MCFQKNRQGTTRERARASEIERAATEKLLEGVDNISNKAKQKGASAQKTDTAAAAVKRSIKTLGDTLNKSAAKKIENGIDKLLPPSAGVKKGKSQISRRRVVRK